MVPCLPVLSNAFLIFEGVTQDTLSSAPKADPSLSLVTHMTQLKFIIWIPSTHRLKSTVLISEHIVDFLIFVLHERAKPSD